MHNLMNNKIVTTGVVIFGIASASEIFFQLYKRVIKFIGENSQINDVFFINNHSMNCFRYHENGKKTSQCNNPFCYLKNFEKIIELIDSAQKSLCLGMYIFTSNELGNAIIRAMERGVAVRIIGDRSMSFSTGSQMLKFMKFGKFCHLFISFINSNKNLMHFMLEYKYAFFMICYSDVLFQKHLLARCFGHAFYMKDFSLNIIS